MSRIFSIIECGCMNFLEEFNAVHLVYDYHLFTKKSCIFLIRILAVYDDQVERIVFRFAFRWRGLCEGAGPAVGVRRENPLETVRGGFFFAPKRPPAGPARGHAPQPQRDRTRLRVVEKK